MSSLISLAIWGAVAAAALFAVHTAWSNFTGGYINEGIKIGADKQLAADTEILEGVKKDRDELRIDRDQWKAAEQAREAENAQKDIAIGKANEALEKINKGAAQLIALNKAILAKQSSSRVKFEAGQARDRGIVLTPQPKRPAEQDLALIDGVTSDALDALGLSKKKPEAAK